eukprot:scaffold1518_cov417-Prasinococcus_capsulatus_cf.AAC.9
MYPLSPPPFCRLHSPSPPPSGGMIDPIMGRRQDPPLLTGNACFSATPVRRGRTEVLVPRANLGICGIPRWRQWPIRMLALFLRRPRATVVRVRRASSAHELHGPTTGACRGPRIRSCPIRDEISSIALSHCSGSIG